MNLPEFLRASPPSDTPRFGPLSYEEANLVEDNLSRLNSEHPYDVETARQVIV